MTSDRDELVGEALRALDVPDHGPDFHARLMARLEEEASRRAGPLRRLHWTRPYTLMTAAAAVALVVLATNVLVRDSSSPRIEPKLITASAVRARVANALASFKTLKGEIAIECEVATGRCAPPAGDGRTTMRWSFVTTAAGDERVAGIGVVDDMAFSSATGTLREMTDDGHGTQGTETTNAAPGPPDAFFRSPLRRELGSVVRAFISDTSEVPVTETVEQGRAAWRLVIAVVPNKLAGPGGSGDQLEVVVDRQSGFPLRITESLAGRFLTQVSLSHLVADAPADPTAFVLVFASGTKVFHQDAGYRRVTLNAAAAIVGYRPILPTDVPAGFELAEVTAAAKGGGTGNEGMNPPAPGVVSVAYRRGFDRIVVTTRLRGSVARCSDPPGSAASAALGCWEDPVASGEGIFDEPQPFVVARGALAGAHAQLVVSARGVPHVWSLDDQLVVTIAGDASATELQRMAASFSPR